ncbi:MAG: DNA-formamidopyrimidine glycosylase [Thermoflavifilum sp.]|nr:DNA-formamidopyrimidine glycosylase [Thermoflavifilum sp.]MCL6513024.1 DNA-formamidopyrimidine glycosylase [Alicyclobacillus sp.]
MPELPEVENVRRDLEALVVGRTIDRVEVRLARIVRTPPDPRVFEALLAGHRIQGVGRRGKYLLFEIPPYTLVSHLRMEGQYRLVRAGEPEAPHTHVVFHLDGGEELRYRDVRQFGTMDLVPPGGELPKGLAELGPEPFDPALDHGAFRRRFHHRTAPIKAVLLDQTCIAGLGNIYVDEALFLVGIHPATPAHRLRPAQAEALLAAIRDVLTRAIAAGGSSVRSYVNGYGRHGGFQMALHVYGREGEPCRRCGTAIEKLRVAGRGTHVCPRCQPQPRRSRRAGQRGARV